MEQRQQKILAACTTISLLFMPPPCLSDAATGDSVLGVTEDGQESELKEQSTPDLQTSDPVTIVITPQWRPLNSQKLPATVNILSEQELDSAGIGSTIDLQYHVPGLVLKTNTVLGQPYLRGIGSDIISVGAEASVATYVDGVYQPRAVGSIQDFYDVERVEVLKGPQGVHLGRNVVGGAVSIISHDPAPYYDAYADVLYGSYDKYQFRGAVNVPIEGTSLAFRLAGSVIKRDGYTDNIFLDEDLDDEDFYAWRGKLRYAPSVDFDVLFSTEHAKEDSTRALGFQTHPTKAVNGGVLLGGTVPNDPRDVFQNIDQFVRVETNRHSLKLSWVLDGVDFMSTTAYQESDIDLALDLDATEIDFSSNFPSETSKSFSQEIRLSSNRGTALSWVAGAFFLHEDATQILDVRLPLAGVRNFPKGSVDTDAYALFGELGYKFSDAWQGTAGMRYSYDRRKHDFSQIIEDPMGTLGPPGTTTLIQNETESWDALTPELTVSYSPKRNAMFYAKASRGFKAGGFNTTGFQPSFGPEFLWAYEIGLKVNFPYQGIRFNGALFYYDYKDMQLATLAPSAPIGTFPSIVNAAKATINGLDLKMHMQATNNTDLSLGLTLLDAEIDEFISVDPNNPAADPDRSGNPLPQAPDISFNLVANHNWALENHGYLALRGEYRYQSAIYFNPFKDSVVKQGGYGIVNASLSFESRKGHWYAELFGNNLTDKEYAQTLFRQDPMMGLLQCWGAPRTVGLRVGYRM